MSALYEFFESEPMAHELQHTLQMIRRLYDSLHLPVDRVEYEIFASFKIRDQPCHGTCQGHIVQYYPMYRSTIRSALPLHDQQKFQPEAWKGYEFLGCTSHPTYALIPLVQQEMNIPPETIHMTEQGCMYLEKTSQVRVDDLLASADRYRRSNYVSYLASDEQDALLAYELVRMMGGQVIMDPVRTTALSSPPQYQILFKLNDYFTSEDLYESMDRIRQGELPQRRFHGAWSGLPKRLPQHENVRRKVILSALGALAYRPLAKNHLYLTPFIRLIYVNALHMVVVPLGHWKQEVLYRNHLKETWDQLNPEDWSVFSVQTPEQLIVYRFYFERKGYFTLVPKVQLDVAGEIYRSWLVVSASTSPPQGDTYEEAKESVQHHLIRSNPPRTNQDPSLLDWIRGDLGPEDLSLYDGLYGYSDLFPLRGLYQHIPLVEELPSSLRAQRAPRAESFLATHVVETKAGPVPLYAQGASEDDVVQGWNQGTWSTPWHRALAEVGGVVLDTPGS